MGLAGALATAVVVILQGASAALAAPTSGEVQQEPVVRRGVDGPKYPAELLRRDLDLIWHALDETHGAPFAHVTRATLRKDFERAGARLTDLNEAEFYGVVTGLLATIRDIHTRAYPSAAYWEALGRNGLVFPAKMQFIGRRAFVVRSKESSLPRGAEVTRINGRPIGSIAREIESHLPIDGAAQTGRRWLLGAQFDLNYYLLIGRPDSFRIELRDQGGIARTVLVAATPIADTVSTTDPPPGAPLVGLRFLPDSSMAVLRVASFNADEIAQAGQDYDSALVDTFRRLLEHRVRDLVIDVRGNDGGRDSYGARLLSHLMRKPFRYYDRLEARTDRVGYWKATQLDSTFNAQWAVGLIKLGPRRFVFDTTRHSNLRIQLPVEPVFPGRVWVLVDGGSNSTTAEFAAVARSLGRAALIGEPTAGVYEANTSGTFAILTLPTSAIRVLIPLVRYHLAVKPPRRRGQGVPVDHPAPPAAADIRRGLDRAMTTAEKLIFAARRSICPEQKSICPEQNR